MSGQQANWLKILNPAVRPRLGQVRHAVFDFDGTLSVLRQGWEPVMEAVMLQAIYPSGDVPEPVRSEVREYIDHSTGQLTILQMRWLADAVRRWGAALPPLSAREYKAHYLEALMVFVGERVAQVERGTAAPEQYLLAGSLSFLKGLAAKGVCLYIASGSDHPDVVREARALGIAPYITGGMYGALDASEVNAKDRVIQRILCEHQISGDALLVVGDGPVEIIEARARGAIALGVASDEVTRQGWNERKIARLEQAGADILVADFGQAEDLVELLVRGNGTTPATRVER